jgi:hypothetical protein
LPKIDPREVFEVCECCLFDNEPQICSMCGMYRPERGRNYFITKNWTVMSVLEIAKKMNDERRKNA